MLRWMRLGFRRVGLLGCGLLFAAWMPGVCSSDTARQHSIRGISWMPVRVLPAEDGTRDLHFDISPWGLIALPPPVVWLPVGLDRDHYRSRPATLATLSTLVETGHVADPGALRVCVSAPRHSRLRDLRDVLLQLRRAGIQRFCLDRAERA